MRFYHGGGHPVTCIDPSLEGADGELLCASASPNVARRYGDTVSVFDLDTEKVIHASVLDWFRGGCPEIAQLRLDGVHAVIVDGDPNIFDFPADTLFVIAPEAVKFTRVLTPSDLEALDDGRSTIHDPAGPNDREWALYAKNHLEDDLDSVAPTSPGKAAAAHP